MRKKNNIPYLTREEIEKGNLKLKEEKEKIQKIEGINPLDIYEIEKKVEEFGIHIATFCNEAYEESVIDWGFDSQEREWVGYRKLQCIHHDVPIISLLEYHLSTSELIEYVYRTPPATNYLSFRMIEKKYSHLILYKPVTRNGNDQWVYEIVSLDCDRVSPVQYGKSIVYQLNCLCNTIGALEDLEEDEFIRNMREPFYEIDVDSIPHTRICRVIDDLNKVGFLDQCLYAAKCQTPTHHEYSIVERVVRCLKYAPNLIAPTSLHYQPYSQYEINEGGDLGLKWYEKEQKDCYSLHLTVQFNPTIDFPNPNRLSIDLFVYDRRKIVWEYHKRMEGIICGKENWITPEYYVSDFLTIPEAIIRYSYRNDSFGLIK